MKTFFLYRVELRRLALSKFTWIVTVLSLCGPLTGYSFLQQSNASVMSGQYIANPVLAGTVIGAILWAVLTLIESNRVYRNKTDILTDAIVSPIRMAFVRMTALASLSAAACFLCILAYLPYTIVKMDYIFNPALYMMSFLILMLPTLWISILLASAIYQIVQRVELAGLLYVVCVYFSFSRFANNDFFPRWINPIIITYSDGFSSLYYLRIALYTRVLWLALAGGIWTLSLICIRRYQKNLLVSFWRSLRKVYLPVTAAALMVTGIMMWRGQPFVDHGPAEFQYWDYYNTINDSKISAVTYRLTAKPESGQLHSIAEYTSTSGGSGIKSIWLNPGYKILRIMCDNQPVSFTATSEFQGDSQRTDFNLTQSGWKTLTIEYEGYPTMLRCFAPYTWGNEVTSDYVSLNNFSSMPSLTGLNFPGTFTLELTLPGYMTPLLNHQFIEDYTLNTDGTKTWTKKESSYIIWLTACDYNVESFNAAGMNVNFVYSKKYETIMTEYNMQEALAEVLSYCTEHLGRLSWAGGSSLMMVQRSAISDGGNAGEGWVEWGESTFTAGNLSDPLKGANAAEVFVHEMVHIWWGGLGVNCGSEWDVSNNDPWSDEGLTVYTTYRLMKDKYGEEYAKQYYIDVWQAAVDIQERGFYYRNPEYLDRLPEQYRADLSTMNRGTNLYSRMPLMILKAEQLVGGEEKMDEILRSVQSRFANNGFDKPFTYQDFLDACGLQEEDLILD